MKKTTSIILVLIGAWLTLPVFIAIIFVCFGIIEKILKIFHSQTTFNWSIIFVLSIVVGFLLDILISKVIYSYLINMDKNSQFQPNDRTNVTQ